MVIISTSSDLIALGENWAYQIGHSMADWKYQLNSAPTIMQRIVYNNNVFIAGSSHINALEDFNPQRTNDLDHWIPMGLYYDLIDDRNDRPFIRVDLNDNVMGYTNQQFFNALDADIRTLRAFQARLLSENNNNQILGVNQIFDFYVQ